MDISVVIPAHNRHDLVKDAIESVFLQTLQPREIIVVDDGSLPPLKLSPYLPRIKLVRMEHSGVSAARNAGARAAVGTCLAFLDSDDLWLPQKLAVQASAMENAGLALSHTDEFWLKGNRWVNQGAQHEKYGGAIFCKILDKCRISPSSFLITKKLFEALGGFDESLKVCEDYDFFLRAALRSEVVYINRKLIVKRAVASDSLSAGIKHIESIRLAILEKIVSTQPLTREHRCCAEAELDRKRAIVK